ncbi:hypothetical protein OQJ18_04640 [Fluoribacter dumoffii]|uniref:Transmembrane protein n=1 Tax=Fluoribacter dumoffii TaxID=463 RepID=A0A377GA99_9GAMM|nr:hypothetical protein [Fluoribacter dumoffii]KTC90280.1 transmembrane protein [Fluoribacter dumoffii NY 23]MCW8385598.1 hypothetical protein [Fluoribacter dumoffii]MCW8418625.1 hypothetical protein [Fluoribacter dumoffii]MCW8453531.1 hypothetical protein [Fluoribacter dumoffii]MCW8459250.1 hypothetical protein [Fluoribacter dumoffii]
MLKLPTTPRIIALKKKEELLFFLGKLSLFLIITSIFIPFSPKLPAPGIDPSWALGLNQAVAQGLAFGKDIIFTLGPYSSLYTKAYHPATDSLMMAGCFYLAISYWFCLLFLMRKTRWLWFFMLCIPFLGMIYARDSLFFSYPLLTGLISHQIISHDRIQLSNSSLLSLVFFIFAPFGLLALIKGSMLILCLLVLFLCFVFFIISNQKKLALICLISPSVSILLFWLAAKQPVASLPDYLTSTLWIASGFTEAMSTDGSISEILLYLMSCLLLFLVISQEKQTSGKAKLFLLGIYFVFLFVSFKTGFTRHVGHAFIPGTSVLLATLFLAFITQFWISGPLILISLSSWYFINSHYTNISIRNNFISSYSSAWHGLKNRIQDPSWLETNFIFTMNFLREQADFPVLQGTTDIYSYDQTYLISSQNIWAPRPVFQSYSVFNQGLAEENTRHLQGKHKPDNIIFKVEPIDQRLPSLEDGASWPLLLTHYQPTRLANNFLFLQKREIPISLNQSKLKSETHFLGERVELLAKNRLLFAEINMIPNFWGKLATLLYKPQQLKITFTLNNGDIKHYRLVANMAKSTFLVSPLIENTTEFTLLYKKTSELNDNEVKSFVITTNHEKNWNWNNSYTINLRQIDY